MPRREKELQPLCGAKNRAGKPCGRRAIPGKARCNLHGGRSTGATTDEGKRRAATANMKHGLQQTREAFEKHGHPATYLEALGRNEPDLMELVPVDAEVGAELRFMRMKLLRSEVLGADNGAQVALVEQIRKLAATQNELRPGGSASGAFTVTLNVVGAEPVTTATPAPVPAPEPACS